MEQDNDTQTTPTQCPDCPLSFDKLRTLSWHYRKIHNKDTRQLITTLFHGGVEPLCKCGCGTPTAFLDLARGFNEYMRGHISRVVNNWGHNTKAQEKSQATRKEMWENGEMVAWTKGLTKETDARIAAYGVKGSNTIKNNKEEVVKRSKRMKEGRLSGVISTLHREEHSQWRGGISPLNHYCHANRRLYNNWKYPKLYAADFKCSRCKSGYCLEVHHDKETFSEIMRKIAKEHNWTESLATKNNPDDPALVELKTKISDAVADYHIANNVSGIVLCEDCHKEEHQNPS